jgi:large subunit ribosomal protein L21
MYAVVRTGGKQYRVSEGDDIRIEKIPGTVGEAVTFEDVLMIGGTDEVQIGKPVLSGATVAGRILEQDRHRKVIVFKFKRRKGYQKKQGHRQAFTRVQITGIQAP